MEGFCFILDFFFFIRQSLIDQPRYRDDVHMQVQGGPHFLNFMRKGQFEPLVL